MYPKKGRVIFIANEVHHAESTIVMPMLWNKTYTLSRLEITDKEAIIAQLSIILPSFGGVVFINISVTAMDSYE